MAGVPFEMKHLMETRVLSEIKQRYQGPPILHLTIRTCGLGESMIADKIKDIEDNLPEGATLAYLPDIAQVRLRYSISGKPKDEMEATLQDLKKKTVNILGEAIYGFGEPELEEVIGQLLIQHNKKLITCESCTGGYLSHRITSVPGSSVYFLGSFVSYAYDFKTSVLNVKQETLENFGAVSEETVKEMILGGLSKTGADIAISISGIAGPDGGTLEKPVGTVWIAVGNRDKIVSKKYLFTKDRMRNIQYSATYALIMLREFLMEFE
jgi:nicotinamide-nucleotide amidase